MTIDQEFLVDLNDPVDGHAIQIRVDLGPGDHWQCTCHRWTMDSPEILTVSQIERVLQDWRKHMVRTPGGAGPGDDPAE